MSYIKNMLIFAFCVFGLNIKCSEGILKFREALLKNIENANGDVNHYNERGLTPLHRSIIAQDIYSINELIKNKCDVNRGIKNAIGIKNVCILAANSSPLMFAVAYGNFEIVKILCEAGADIKKRNKDGIHAKKLAIQLMEDTISQGSLQDLEKRNEINEYLKYIAFRKKLLKDIKKANNDVNYYDEMGRTPLQRSIIIQDIYSINKLIENNCDVNLCTKLKIAEDSCNLAANSSPLMIAVAYGNFEIVKILCDAGADILEGNKDGIHAKNLASQLMKDMISQGREKGLEKRNKINEYLERIKYTAFRKRLLESIQKANNDVNYCDEMERTPLHRSIIAEDIYAINELIKHKCDINRGTKNKIGIKKCKLAANSSPLMIAVVYGNFEIVKILCDAGADIVKENEDGIHAKKLASYMISQSSKEDLKNRNKINEYLKIRIKHPGKTYIYISGKNKFAIDECDMSFEQYHELRQQKISLGQDPDNSDDSDDPDNDNRIQNREKKKN